MSPGVTLSVHLWRGCGGDTQRDLFLWRWRLGFATVAVERTDVLTAYRKLRGTVVDAVAMTEPREGR